MSMIGEYLRVTPDELTRAVSDPDWALELIEQIQDVEDEQELPPADARLFTTYKTWDMLGFLFRRFNFPVDVVHGEEPFAEDGDWGYGPPRFVPVERVGVAAREMSRVSYDDLIRRVGVGELAEAKVYPLGWDSPGELDWARGYYGDLALFFAAAAACGQAVIVWLD
ncbi:YfbM family protein [Catenulispora sp. NL8]|uniref:YfbM family protein n=1 Tax=Catenulispora pinistramenti TaxID=2705254 RepID=A0ABS5KLI4_9ACTN|nr:MULTISPECIES: YfbM family protein [Catenulispora]MBS2546899.1 YfbM family protein [Catenulispora pinistramenti]